MPFGLDSYMVPQFTANIEMALQQKDSRFEKAVMIEHLSGKVAQAVNRVGTIEANQITGRLQPMLKSEAPLESRWVAPKDYDSTQYVDRLDLLRTIIDPTSTFVSTAVAAMMRAKDNEIIRALFGNSLTGLNGTDVTPYSTVGSQVGVQVGTGLTPTDTGLNVAKLLKARQLLKAREIDFDMDPIFMAITAEQEANLLSDIKVISKDFNPAMNLVDGKLPSYLGVNFIHSEKLPVDGSGNRINPMWVKSGMALGIWKDKETSVDQRKDMRGLPWQIYLLMTFGATRLDEKKVIQVLNKEGLT